MTRAYFFHAVSDEKETFLRRRPQQGVTSFRHLSSQLVEIQSIIGKMLLGDFQVSG
jgi:hypothetical protein